jgi:hypothetical protein
MAPLEEARQADEDDSRGVVGAAGLHQPFHVQRQLLSKKQILRGELAT